MSIVAKVAASGRSSGFGHAGGASRAGTSAPELGRHRDGLVDPGHERAEGGVGGERHLAADRLDDHQGERVDVAAAVERGALGLLGRGVAGGAEHRAGGLGPGGLGEGAGEAEVGDAQAALVVEEEVGRLDVAVDEAPAVGVLERTGGLEADLPGLGRVEAVAGVEQAPQRTAAEQLGDEVGHVALAPVVHRHDVRVVEAGGVVRLGPEPLEELRVVGQRVVQDLDRDATTEHHVVGEVHGGGRPGADGGEQPVTATEHLTDTVDHAGDGHRPTLQVAPVEFGYPSTAAAAAPGPTAAPPRRAGTLSG